jgi:hypothetical protein
MLVNKILEVGCMRVKGGYMRHQTAVHPQMPLSHARHHGVAR